MRSVFRFLSVILLLLSFSAAHAQIPTTPNIGLQLPPRGYAPWDTIINSNSMTVDTVLGELQASYQGSWSNTATYAKGQMVTSGSILYQSLVAPNTGNAPGTSPSDWVAVLNLSSSSIIANLGFTPENSQNRGIANGYAPLDANSFVPLANIPSLPESQITNLTADLSSAQSAASTKLPLAGGTLTGPLVAPQSNGVWNICQAPGIRCDGVTDDTTAFQTLLNTVSAMGGGTLQGQQAKTMLLLGQITIPRLSSSSPWPMAPIRITGSGASMGAADNPIGATPGAAFTIDARYAGNRIVSLGQGTLEIDHLNLVNGGASCGTFIYTTLTNLNLHDDSIFGSLANGGLGVTTQCDDVWVAGGGNGTANGLTGTVNDYFQGYASYIHNNFADYIRAFIVGGVAFNSIPIRENTIWKHSGSNLTTAISAATNASQTILTTSTNHNLPIGSTLTLTFSGFTGGWASLNGAHSVTVASANTLSVATNSTSFGALTGTPAYLSGYVMKFDGTATTGYGGAGYEDQGNIIAGNLIEQSNYPFGIVLAWSGGTEISGQSCWDYTSVSIACVWQQSNSYASHIVIAHSGTVSPVLSANSTQSDSTIFNAFAFQQIYGGGVFAWNQGSIAPWINLGVNGTTYWQETLTPTTNFLRIIDSANSLTRLEFDPASSSHIASGGTAAVNVNDVANDGTGGLNVYSGGTNPVPSIILSGNGTLTLQSTNQPQIWWNVGGTNYFESYLSAAGGSFRIADVPNAMVRFQIDPAQRTFINSAGTYAIQLNFGTNAGTGGVLFGSGGASPTTVGSVSNTGLGTFNGGVNIPSGQSYQVNGVSGATKTCTTYPTVVGGIVTSC